MVGRGHRQGYRNQIALGAVYRGQLARSLTNLHYRIDMTHAHCTQAPGLHCYDNTIQT